MTNYTSRRKTHISKSIVTVDAGKTVSAYPDPNDSRQLLVEFNNGLGVQVLGRTMAADWEEVIPAPEPEPTKALPQLGVHVMRQTDTLNTVLAAGCRFVVTVDNLLGALDAARDYPAATVVIRPNLDKGRIPTHDEVIQKSGVSANWPPNIAVTALNEDDQGLKFSTNITARYNFDVEMARRIKAINPNVVYLASVYPPACNEEGERAWIEEMKRTYAVSYNRGDFAIDYHGYERMPDGIYTEADWFSRRWGMLFKCCGFDVASPAAKGIYMTECGVDVGSIGGFKELGFTEERFRRWMGAFIENTFYEGSPVKACALFQYGSYDWLGYDVSQFRNVLEEIWNGTFTATMPEPEQPPVYSISASATTIKAGDVVRISTNTARIEGQWLVFDGREVALLADDHGNAFLETALTKTTRFELRVMLRDKTEVSPRPCVTVTVTPPIVIPPPPPPPTGNVTLGVHCITDGRAAKQALSAGCQFIVWMGDPTVASQWKDAYPDAMIVVRPNLTMINYLPTAGQVMNALKGATDKRLIYTGCNESEQIGWTPDEIARHAALDVDVARFVKANGGIYAAGSPSMGVPDFNDPAICDAIRAHYAPHFNSGLLWWDCHLYSPHISRVGMSADDAIWFETRWKFLYRECGFSGASPSRIICTETGLDTGDRRGFKGNNINVEQVQAWARWFYRLQTAPFVGGAIFQLGDAPDWQGFNLSGYMDGLKACGWGRS